MNLTGNVTVSKNAGDDDDALITSLEYSVAVMCLIGISMTVGSLLTIVGNVFVFIIYFKTKSLQTAKNYFILSLAVADVIIAAIPVNLYTVYMLFGYWPLGHLFCHMWLVIDYWACTVSTLTLLAIAFDRFSAACFPLSHRVRQSKQYIRKVIISIWITAFLVWAPAIVIYPYAHGEHTVPEDQCYIQFLFENWQVTFATAFFSYYGPVLITTVLYSCISCKLVQRVSMLHQKRKSSKYAVSVALAVSAQSTVQVGSRDVPNRLLSNVLHSNLMDIESCDSSFTQSLTDLSVVQSSPDISSFPSIRTLPELPCSNELSKLPRASEINKSFTLSVNNLSTDKHFHDGNVITLSSLPDLTIGEIYTIKSTLKTSNSADVEKTKRKHTDQDSPHWLNKNPQNQEICLKRKNTTKSREMKTSKMFRNLRKKMMSSSETVRSIQMSKSAKKKTIQDHKRGIRLLLLVILAFSISWLPYYLSTVVVSITKIRLPEPLWRFCYIIGWFNSLLNPLCYAFGNKKFKRGFKQIFKGKNIATNNSTKAATSSFP